MSTPAPQPTARPLPPQLPGTHVPSESQRNPSTQAQTTETVTSSAVASAVTKRSSVVRNVLSNWSGYIFSVVVSFFLAPYVVNHLGTTAYGVWSLVISLTGYLGLLDLGVRGAVTRYVARFHAQADHQRSSQVASAAMAIFGGSGLATISVSLLLAISIVGRMNIPAEYLTAARSVLVLTGISIAVSLINGVYGGMLIALQRFDLSNGIEVVTAGLRAVAIVVALNRGEGLVTLAGIQVGFTLLRLLANVVFLHKLYPQVRVRPRSADAQNLRLIFSFSVFSCLLHASRNLIYDSDLVVIGAYLPVTAVTFYAIGGNLVDYARALISGISQTMTPLASSLEAKQGAAGVRELLLKSSPWGTIVALPIAITFLIRGNSFIELWMGAQFAESSGDVLKILAIVMLFGASGSIVGSVLLGISRHKPLVPAFVAEGLCNLGLSIWLVHKMGIIGVAWGTLIPSLFTNFAFIPWYVRRVLGVSPWRYAQLAWLKPGLAAVPFAIITYAVEQLWPAGNLLIFFLQVALCLSFLVACDWRICLNANQRLEYLRKFTSTLGRVSVRT
jgi:O-antigen/teichoic acid export membrane protein